MRHWCIIGLVILLAGRSLAGHAAASPIPLSKDPNLAALKALLAEPENRVDLAQAEVTIERMIDPTVKPAATLHELDAWADRVSARIPPGASNMQKLVALNTTLYQPGPWNDNRPFAYDFDDPLGKDIQNKLLTTYLKTRKGNCVSMPMLYVILGQKIGLDMTLATAPLHVFVKFHQDDGTWLNVEATSGGTLRDQGYVDQFHIQPRALLTGIYLRPLSKKESVGVLIDTLEEFYAHHRAPEFQLDLTELALGNNPKDVLSLLMRGSAYYHLLQTRYLSRYARPEDIPASQQADYQMLSNNNLMLFAKAERLGWREPTVQEDVHYLQQIQHDKAK
ncbi:MAG: transglutaminase family protein [Dyella sp.]|uniref:transglutaminase family protein n=1 Tax=Dyella sp. TaxID=1869338 RepID=UPI003F807A82